MLQHKFILQPGETKEIRMVFGVSESLDEARAVAKMYADAKSAESACKEAVEYNLDKYSSLSVTTPDSRWRPARYLHGIRFLHYGIPLICLWSNVLPKSLNRLKNCLWW